MTHGRSGVEVSGTRDNPKWFPLLSYAKLYASETGYRVWASVEGHEGVFLVYPGGRIEHKLPRPPRRLSALRRGE